MNDWKRVQGENDLRFSPISRVEIKIYMKYEGIDIFRIVFNLKTWQFKNLFTKEMDAE